MRYRICDSVLPIPEYAESDVYRKFKYQFDNLFNEGDTASDSKDFIKMYVHDSEFETNIRDFVKSWNSAAQFCVGYTGIGKSTTIKYCFDLGTSTVPILKKSFDNPNKYMVVFPTFLDGQLMQTDDFGRVKSVPDAEVLFNLPGRISSVCSVLEAAHPELRSNRMSPNGVKEFYDFIVAHTPRILEFTNENSFVSEWELASLTDEQVKLKKLEYAERFYRFEYIANKLKYYLLKKYNTYNRLVIILDDIETMPENFQDAIIKDYLHLFTCMQNTDYPADHDYRVNLLISVRPHTYRIFQNGIRGRQLEAYPLERPILKRKPVDLEAFFEKRFDYYTDLSKTLKSIGNIDTWKDCYAELMKMNRAFEGKYRSMIMNLLFMNVRKSLTEYSKIFANRFWVQKNRIRQGEFKVSSDEYKFNNVTVLRAIGCGDAAVFTGEKATGGICSIPSIFYTTIDNDFSIQSLLVMQYFKRKMRPLPGGIVEYGLDAESMERVTAEWRQALGEKRLEQLLVVLTYLFERKVLRKSILDFDDYENLDNRLSIGNHSRLYLSPLGDELLDMLKRDSIYLEMLRECSWREYNGHEQSYSRDGSYILKHDGKLKAIFIDLLEYVDALREYEEDFINQENTDLSEYRKLFGNTLAVDILFQGIENSLNYTDRINDHSLSQKLKRVKKRLDETRNRLMGIDD